MFKRATAKSTPFFISLASRHLFSIFLNLPPDFDRESYSPIFQFLVNPSSYFFSESYSLEFLEIVLLYNTVLYKTVQNCTKTYNTVQNTTLYNIIHCTLVKCLFVVLFVFPKVKDGHKSTLVKLFSPTCCTLIWK